MSETERRVSATEARVHFGELLDGVTTRHDVVFVERAGKEVAVVVSIEDWEAACTSRSDKWARASAMLAELHERLRAEGAIERLKDFEVEEAFRAGWDDRAIHGCTPGHWRSPTSTGYQRRIVRTTRPGGTLSRAAVDLRPRLAKEMEQGLPEVRLVP